jgi:hypothetical protein
MCTKSRQPKRCPLSTCLTASRALLWVPSGLWNTLAHLRKSACAGPFLGLTLRSRGCLSFSQSPCLWTLPCWPSLPCSWACNPAPRFTCPPVGRFRLSQPFTRVEPRQPRPRRRSWGAWQSVAAGFQGLDRHCHSPWASVDVVSPPSSPDS